MDGGGLLPADPGVYGPDGSAAGGPCRDVADARRVAGDDVAPVGSTSAVATLELGRSSAALWKSQLLTLDVGGAGALGRTTGLAE